jgi:hypothetical protein
MFLYFYKFNIIYIGVPIPDNSSIPRTNLIYREIYVCLINTNTYEFFGNTARVRGLWETSSEDRWKFSD